MKQNSPLLVFDGAQYVPIKDAKAMAKAGRNRINQMREALAKLTASVENLEKGIDRAEKGTN